MTSFIRDLYDFFLDHDEWSAKPPPCNPRSTSRRGGVRFSNEWLQQRTKIDLFLKEHTDESLTMALKTFAKVIDTLDLYAPALKGLTDVHAYACETLESVIFDQQKAGQRGQAAAFLYGQAMAMSTLTSEAVTLAIENLGDHTASNLALCIILGVERSSPLLFESHLPELLRQVQMSAFSNHDKSVPQEALIRALKIYSPSEKASSCQMILQATHALLEASMHLCRAAAGDVRGESKEGWGEAEVGVFWTCFLIKHMPMTLRMDLAHRYPSTIRSLPIFTLLLPLSLSPSLHLSPQCQAALCLGLPVLATWDTSEFVESSEFERTVRFMSSMALIYVDRAKRLGVEAMNGLGQLASIVLDRFEPFLQDVGHIALHALSSSHAKRKTTQKAAQRLLARLLASQGPTTLDIMISYLHSPPHVLLENVHLLEMIATLLPNLAKRIIQTLMDIIDTLLEDDEKDKKDEKGGGRAKGEKGCRRESVLEALNVFPLRGEFLPTQVRTEKKRWADRGTGKPDNDLAARAQKLVLKSLDEDNGKEVVIAALQLATNPVIATSRIMHNLTFKIAQLLLADALSVLSNPAVASMLNERSCSMILLALRQSLEPNIQIVAAKLLAHLTTVHRAIVQPLAWSHIRQSLGLMDFLESVDPIKAIIEACIISNLLPALPPSLHKKYVGPVKELIMAGLRRQPCEEPHVLSLVFQGLSNLARFEDYSSAQQSHLVHDLLEMTHEIPKECQHAALNAISSLLSVPKDGLDVYELLIKVHANVGGGRGKGLDNDLKALDSKAAINREMLNYTPKITHASRISEVRDRYGALHPTTINTLLAENLLQALSTSLKATDDRSLVLEIMSCLGILQPRAIPGLIPDLPNLIMSELKHALKSRDSARDVNSTNVSAGLLFLSSTMHMSGLWMERYWGDMAELMGECVKNGETLPVLRGLDLVLAAIKD
ncbi:hypothetical protein I306_04100 [Cryptococcus gattii EJB2]|uniref:UNC-45/Cro1/She4 central domain-containing protein n=1 Tax=Cryptococcus gattii EJB2 TaxID=1296103 RepID=A0ABR5BTB5_9TREE|nr:hypothetical protein I306_04100 [Cryptococcus gattii EJB2]